MSRYLYIHVGRDADENFEIGMHRNIWGWKTFHRGGATVAEAEDWLRNPDLAEPTWLVFVRGVRPVLPAPTGWPRTRPEDFGAWKTATIESMTYRLLIAPLHEDHVSTVWRDDRYPYRVELDPEPEENVESIRADALDEQALRAIRHSTVQKGWPVLGPPPFAVASLKPDKRISLADGRETRVRTIPIERNLTTTFERRPGETVIAARKEAALVERYREFLRAEHGQQAVRNEIALPGRLDTFFTDMYVEEIDELLEAKSSTRREHIRLAIGQLCDYARFVEPASRAVLLPKRPEQDLVDLLASQNIACVYEASHGQFVREGRGAQVSGERAR
ncbi:hypothetical protein ACQP1P_01835 [Dactylosporangium sp. CA-052675]|uniref:hypothetical protein n=1 Tax=Dactylosporangium sp. CA-052675 TaxID=3239927 RepID=UPI003D8A2B19